MFLDQDKENHIQQYGFVYIGVLTPQNQALILSCNFPGDSPASGAVVGAFQWYGGVRKKGWAAQVSKAKGPWLFEAFRRYLAINPSGTSLLVDF